LIFGDLPIDIEREKFIVGMERDIIKVLLFAEKDVIVDDINLNPKHIQYYEDLARNMEAILEVEFIDQSLPKCIENDAKRSRSVGKNTITNLAHQYRLVKQETEFVLYELDEVLARRYSRRDMGAIYSGLNKDVLIDRKLIQLDKPNLKYVTKLEDDINIGYEPILITARPECVRKETEEWLAFNGVPCARLLMRPNHDLRYQSSVKRWLFDSYLDGDLCKKIVDTSEAMCTTWKNLDISKEIVN
jgi:hypothetical protein